MASMWGLGDDGMGSFARVLSGPMSSTYLLLSSNGDHRISPAWTAPGRRHAAPRPGPGLRAGHDSPGNEAREYGSVAPGPITLKAWPILPVFRLPRSPWS